MLYALMLAVGLTGFVTGQEVLQDRTPGFELSLASTRAAVDAKSAASMISGYRRNHGLGPVAVDHELMRLAREHAAAMAAHDEMGHNVGTRFEDRIGNSKVRASTVAENVGAGYRTLGEAFAGWRDSPGHRANMLHPDVSRIGIAAAYAPGSKYKVFWALILASPNGR